MTALQISEHRPLTDGAAFAPVAQDRAEPEELVLTWQPYTDEIFGPAYTLNGLPDSRSSGAAYRSLAGHWVAHAFIDGAYLNHKGRTAGTAMKRLEREIDKRSIGLFGLDTISFVQAAK